MITYANMITLIVFFILVYSFINVFYKVIKGMIDVVNEVKKNCNEIVEDED